MACRRCARGGSCSGARAVSASRVAVRPSATCGAGSEPNPCARRAADAPADESDRSVARVAESPSAWNVTAPATMWRLRGRAATRDDAARRIAARPFIVAATAWPAPVCDGTSAVDPSVEFQRTRACAPEAERASCSPDAAVKARVAGHGRWSSPCQRRTRVVNLRTDKPRDSGVRYLNSSRAAHRGTRGVGGRGASAERVAENPLQRWTASAQIPAELTLARGGVVGILLVAGAGGATAGGAAGPAAATVPAISSRSAAAVAPRGHAWAASGSSEPAGAPGRHRRRTGGRDGRGCLTARSWRRGGAAAAGGGELRTRECERPNAAGR